ncbi:MAG: hypothetical protein M5U05_18055 [Anaerolineales bacterium]|nr:hypothetical protein [Anaerolineales bacterium]
MAEASSFHVRNAQPDDLLAALTVLQAYPGLSSVADIAVRAETMGLSIRDRLRLEALMTARELGLVHGDSNELTLDGEKALELEGQKPELFGDIVHGLQYMLWVPFQQWEHCFSWTYQAVCRSLWRQVRVEVDPRILASELEVEARTQFARNDIALSGKSVRGVLMWLRELRPRVISEDDNYLSRHFCPPELFLLALDYVYRSEVADYGTNLLLNEERRDAICQMCLLDTEAFDRVLQYAVGQFPILQRGIGGGWGHYMSLERRVTLGVLG